MLFVAYSELLYYLSGLIYRKGCVFNIYKIRNYGFYG